MNTVYIIQELPGTKIGTPKFNIMGAQKFGTLKTLLPEHSQIILSPGPLIFKLRKLLDKYTTRRFFTTYRRSCNYRCCMFNCGR